MRVPHALRERDGDSGRLLLEALYDHLQQPKACYYRSSAMAQDLIVLSQHAGWDTIQGARLLRSANAMVRGPLETYCEALRAYNDLLLLQTRPSLSYVLRLILSDLVRATGADMGNIQTMDHSRRALTITAERGFDRPFLDFFACVSDGGTACAKAWRHAERVIVEDVTDDPIFFRSPGLCVLLDAGVRAVQSTPIVDESGDVCGILSTHYRRPSRPGSEDLTRIDSAARRAGALIRMAAALD